MADKRSKVSFSLLILLMMVALGNFLFVHIAFNKDGPSDDVGIIAPAGGGFSAISLGKSPHFGDPNGPELRGEVVVEKKQDGKYDLTIFARNKNNEPVILEGFSSDVHLLGMTEPRVIPAFRKVGNGKYTATMAFPERGRWEVRVRLNKKNESLEFYESFDIF